MAWHRSKRAGLAIRLGGVACIAAAGFATRALLARASGAAGALDYLLALIAFAGGSAGAVMIALGAKLFDRIAVSSRWLSVGDLIVARRIEAGAGLRLVERVPAAPEVADPEAVSFAGTRSGRR